MDASLRKIFDAYRQNPYRNIFIALAVVVLIDALAPSSAERGRFADLMIAVLLVASLIETVRARRNVTIALALGLPAIILRVISAFTPDSKPMNTTVVTLTALFLGFLIWNMLHDLAKSGRPTSERIYGALCAYVFIGLLFSLVYTHAEYRHPGSFSLPKSFVADDATDESNLFPVFTYFSFVTLTTLGYGDVTPVAEHARTLAWFEALVGQLYLAVMVAGFVAIHVSERIKRDRGDPPPGG